MSLALSVKAHATMPGLLLLQDQPVARERASCAFWALPSRPAKHAQRHMRERRSPFPAAVMEWIQAGAALGLQATDAGEQRLRRHTSHHVVAA